MGLWGGIIGGAIGLVAGPWGAVAGAAIGAAIGEAVGGKDKKAESDAPPPLSLQIVPNNISGPEFGNIEVFEIKMKGVIAVPKNDTKVKVVIFVRDCKTEQKFEDGEVILTSDNSLSSIGNMVLSPEQEVTIPYEVTEYQDWSVIEVIPVGCMIFPFHGDRNIEFVMLIRDDKDDILAVASSSIAYHIDEIGFMEYEDYKRKAEQFALDISGILASSSGYPTLETWSFIKQWIIDRVKIRNEDDQAAVKSLLEEELKSVRNTSSGKNISGMKQKMLNSYAQQMKENLRICDRFEFATFFIKLVATFENITEQDIKRLDFIAGVLEVDMNEFHAEKQKHLPVSELNTDDPFLLLGIPPAAPTVEKKKKLNELFLKWNNLAIHKDEKMRKKAEKMLDAIADCRKRI